MSENFGNWMGQVNGGQSVPYQAIAPDFATGTNYAPVDFDPGPSSYTPIGTRAVGDSGAQNLNARVIREQYADYERRFKPIEDMAVGLITDTGTKDLPLDLARTRETVGGVFGNIQGQQGRAMERFGQVNKSDNITGSNAEAGAMVGGLNMATFADEARRMKLLGGGSTSAASVVRGDGGSN